MKVFHRVPNKLVKMNPAHNSVTLLYVCVDYTSFCNILDIKYPLHACLLVHV